MDGARNVKIYDFSKRNIVVTRVCDGMFVDVVSFSSSLRLLNLSKIQRNKYNDQKEKKPFSL